MKIITLGIIGGGQLGQMTASAAKKMNIRTVIYTNQENSPASQRADKTIVSEYDNHEHLQEFANLCDVITYEFENIPVDSVALLEKTDKIFPSASILKITQNRILEKTFLNEIGIQTATFRKINTQADLENGFTDFGKSVLKTNTLGYDGKGQFVIEDKSHLSSIWQEIQVNNSISNGLVLEKFCPFASEASILVARSTKGEVSCYEPLTNIHKNGILDISTYPAKISDSCKIKAKETAREIAEKIDLCGLLAIEFFVLENEELIVNEMAPRPHNSGHFSMDASKTSQFKQLILAVTGQELGDPSFHSSGHMQNLIGNQVEDLDQYQQNNKAIIHLYGKDQIKQGRKMGHVNLINKPCLL
jgi:5-(carboxyamino)imidazole ribonucleotide synthase